MPHWEKQLGTAPPIQRSLSLSLSDSFQLGRALHVAIEALTRLENRLIFHWYLPQLDRFGEERIPFDLRRFQQCWKHVWMARTSMKPFGWHWSDLMRHQPLHIFVPMLANMDFISAERSIRFSMRWKFVHWIDGFSAEIRARISIGSVNLFHRREQVSGEKGNRGISPTNNLRDQLGHLDDLSDRCFSIVAGWARWRSFGEEICPLSSQHQRREINTSEKSFASFNRFGNGWLEHADKSFFRGTKRQKRRKLKPVCWHCKFDASLSRRATAEQWKRRGLQMIE